MLNWTLLIIFWIFYELNRISYLSFQINSLFFIWYPTSAKVFFILLRALIIFLHYSFLHREKKSRGLIMIDFFSLVSIYCNFHLFLHIFCNSLPFSFYSKNAFVWPSGEKRYLGVGSIGYFHRPHSVFFPLQVL